MPFDPSTINPETYYSVSEAAKLVGRTGETIRAWVRKKKVEPANKDAGRILIKGSELLKVMIGEPAVRVPITHPKQREKEIQAELEWLRKRGVKC